MGQFRPLFVYFRSFLVTISIQIEKKHRWYAWDSNLGPQDGRRRQYHGAMAATHTYASHTYASHTYASHLFNFDGSCEVRSHTYQLFYFFHSSQHVKRTIRCSV